MRVDKYLKDNGRLDITGNPNDLLKFKVPGLKNVEVTVPYIHDGRKFSISGVVKHYRTGIVTSDPTLDPLLKDRISMTDQEKIDLVAFLRSLTDNVLLKDARFGQPN